AQQTRPGPQQPQSGSQQPARDTSAQKDTPPTPTGRISGRVVTADNGRPVKRARVFVTAAELPGGRGVLTEDTGVFDLTELPAGPAQTDDRGQYRVWGLMPGDYYVNALTRLAGFGGRGFGPPGGPGGGGAPVGPPGGGRGGRGGDFASMFGGGQDPEQVNYAP